MTTTHSSTKDSLLYPRYSYRGDFSPEQLVFNANLQEFAQKVEYLSAFHTGGKMTTRQIYTELRKLWQQLEQSHQQLLDTN